ncbi:putative amidase [Medicago truncatula]|uniref:Putative amidase n=1 Tax=Medicago truncatula TaxID=3880 RepID=A0A072UQ78_MEDTR|nr:outer envelope protein 64, mitochondrial [Medicago truncatula]KEH31213.1 translocon at the outer membrane ofs-like protein [Medicago truncatula]RHN62711.1 putative amidase [Medicago truncatula]
MSQSLKLIKDHTSNPKLWLIVGIGLAGGIVVLSETRRRRRCRNAPKPDFGAFIERFELLPFPQSPPPAAKQLLSSLTFAISDIFDVKGYVTGFGNPLWKRTHEEAEKTAMVVTALLFNGATCVGKTVMDEFSFGFSGENKYYGTPINPQMPSCVPGGSSSGSAVAVAAGLVDFAIGTDTTGCVRIPASLCGIFGFRPSHGAISTIGVLPNAQSLETIGWFARDPSVLHRVGLALLQLNSVDTKKSRCIIFADDLFQSSKDATQKIIYVIGKAIENMSGYQSPKHMDLCEYIVKKVPSLRLHEQSAHQQNGTSILKTLSSVMLSIQRYEFKSNYEEWVKSVKRRLSRDVPKHVYEAITTTHDNIKALYKVRHEMHAAFQSLLKDGGILVIPSVADSPLKLNAKKGFCSEFHDRSFALSSIATMSGCCQVTIPLGYHDGCCISVSFISNHGGDKFLLDTILDMYTNLQEQASSGFNSMPLPNINGNTEPSELLKEKGNAAFKEQQWDKAVTHYTGAIELNGTNATYYCNRAAACLKLGCFQLAEEDCSKAILLDKKNVKAYLRRGTARESLLRYKEALEDFKHALVLEPQNKYASLAEQRVRKLTS